MGRGATNQGANTVRRNQGATINYYNFFAWLRIKVFVLDLWYYTRRKLEESSQFKALAASPIELKIVDIFFSKSVTSSFVAEASS